MKKLILLAGVAALGSILYFSKVLEDSLEAKLDRVVARIEQEIKPEDYGWGEVLTWKPYAGPSGHVFIPVPRGEARSSPYDCFDASVTVMKILREEGIDSDIYQGKDQLGIMGKHFWVVAENGEYFDGLPQYALRGAKHIPKKIIDKRNISDENFLTVSRGPVALGYSKEGENEHHSNLGIESQPRKLEDMLKLKAEGKELPPILFAYQMLEIKSGRPSRAYTKFIVVEDTPFEELVTSFSDDPYTSLMEVSLEEMQHKGVISITEGAISANNFAPTKIELSMLSVEKVRDLKKRAESDMGVVEKFVKNCAYAMRIEKVLHEPR